MRKIIGISCFLGMCLLVLSLGPSPKYFIDIPSILFVTGLTTCLVLIKHSLAEIQSFTDEVVLSLINFSLVSGAIGFLIGLVQMVLTMSDHHGIGIALSVNLLTVFYSLIISSCLYVYKRSRPLV